MTSRQAVRVLLFDQADRVLLVRFSDGDRSWWCTPGGGVEAGETEEEAARRELREELSSVAIALGPCIWTRLRISLQSDQSFRSNPISRFGVFDHPGEGAATSGDVR